MTDYNITFQQIDLFLEVAETLNITTTAEKNYISQPALSKMLKRLEDRISLKLFNKDGRNIILTNEGKMLYDSIKDSFESINAAIDNVQQNNKVIRIGYPSSLLINPYYGKLTEYIESYRNSHPDLKFDEAMYELDKLCTALNNGDLDVVFIHDFLLDDLKDVDSFHLFGMRSYLAVNKELVEGVKKEELGEVLRSQPYLSCMGSTVPKSNGVSRKWLEEYGIMPAEQEVVSNLMTLLYRVSQNSGYGIVGSIQLPIDNVTLLPIKQEQDTHSVCAVWKPKNVSFYLDALLEDLNRNFSFPSSR